MPVPSAWCTCCTVPGGGDPAFAADCGWSSGATFFPQSIPDDVTNYVLAVSFDEDGNVEDISMES